MEEEIQISESEDEQANADSPPGHPIETKTEVLENLFKGYPYHKNGPAQGYKWNEQEIEQMAKHLEEYASKVQRGRRKKIRATRFDGRPVTGGLLKFVNDALTGKTFPNNPHIKRRRNRYRAGYISQHALWHEASEILIAEFDYWMDVHQDNIKHAAENRPELIRYPKIEDLVFRNNEDFVGGLWSDFERHWQRFIDEISPDNNEMKEDVRESLKHGVNFIDRTCPCPRSERKVWRVINGQEVEIYNVAIKDSEYTAKRLGRRDYTKTKNCQPNSTCGYAPRIYQEDIATEKDMFAYPTGGRNLEYMHVICSQLKSWLDQNVITYLGHKKTTGAEMDALVIPSFIVEEKKPRICLDGSCFTCLAPKPKMPCILDSAADFLRLLSPNDTFAVADDQSGFLQALVNDRSQTLTRMLFAHLYFSHRALAFGHTLSPPKFQWLNRIAVTAMNKRLIDCLLYLDDRVVREKLYRKLEPGETGIGIYTLHCLLVAFGGFVSNKKCDFIPKTAGVFLGFHFDTIAQTISVPTEKHDKVKLLIAEFVQGVIINGVKYYNFKLLEKIRGKINSWSLVCSNSGFYTREMNYALAVLAARFPDYIIKNYLVKADEVSNIEELEDELQIWVDLHYTYLTRKWRKQSHNVISKPLEIYTDASGAGLGAAQFVNGKKTERKFAMPLWLAPKAIHVKEGYAILATLKSYDGEFNDSYLVVHCDNEGVCKSWEGQGSRDIDLSRVFKELRQYCHDRNIHLTLKWVCTSQQEADAPSREITPIFSQLKKQYSNRLLHMLQVNLDLFASFENRLGHCRFFSEFQHPEATGIDGMSYTGNPGDVCYAYPPRVLVNPFVKDVVPKIQKLIMVRHVYDYEDHQYLLFERAFQFKQLIGCRKLPACITPWDKKDSDIPYYRDYSEPQQTYLYFKGFSLDLLRQYTSTFIDQSECSNCQHSRRRRLVKCEKC